MDTAVLLKQDTSKTSAAMVLTEGERQMLAAQATVIVL